MLIYKCWEAWVPVISHLDQLRIYGLNTPRETVNVLHPWFGKNAGELHGIRVSVHQISYDLNLWVLFNLWYNSNTYGRSHLYAHSTPLTVTLRDIFICELADSMFLTPSGLYIQKFVQKGHRCNIYAFAMNLWARHHALQWISMYCCSPLADMFLYPLSKIQ